MAQGGNVQALVPGLSRMPPPVHPPGSSELTLQAGKSPLVLADICVLMVYKDGRADVSLQLGRMRSKMPLKSTDSPCLSLWGDLPQLGKSLALGFIMLPSLMPDMALCSFLIRVTPQITYSSLLSKTGIESDDFEELPCCRPDRAVAMQRH